MRTLLISLGVGLLGGGLGALLLITFVLPISSLVPADQSPVLPITFARRTAQDEFQISEALASIIPFIKPNPDDAFSSFEKAVGAGLALTSDGLLISPTALKSMVGLKGVPSSGLPFALAAALQKNGKPIVLADMNLTLLKAVAPGESLRLTPVTLSGFEDLAVGQSVFAVNAAQQISWHHIAARYSGVSPAQPVSSEAPQGGFFTIDGEAQEGDFLFNGQGQLVGIARGDGAVMPAEWIAAAARQYLKDGAYRPVALGIRFIDLRRLIVLASLARQAGLRIEGDRTHRAIVPGSPASQAGLRSGDVIIAFDGRRFDGTVPLPLLLQRYIPGAEVEVVFIRNGKEEKTKVVLGAK